MAKRLALAPPRFTTARKNAASASIRKCAPTQGNPRGRLSADTELPALTQVLSAGSTVSALRLPLGLPWVGAHFRIDALAAFFLAVVNLGGASASLFAIGYGEHEKAPGRVLPFYAAFLAGMNLVVLADDAFTFLVSW